MPYPLVATIASTPIYWSDATTLWDGTVLFVLSRPSGYTQSTVINQNPAQVVGDHVRIKIVNGVPDQSARVIYTSYLDPPGCKYAAFWYDTEGTSIYTPTLGSELFTVISTPKALPVVTLTKPTAASIIPTP